jgi:flagellar basal-body rod modification protein FlgD
MQVRGTVTANPMATNALSSTSSSTQNSAVVTANDFLTLLVTELKNQDPTANTDPNAYVDQLVQVNSLQQLIQISQNTTGTTTAGTTTTGTTTPTPGS